MPLREFEFFMGSKQTKTVYRTDKKTKAEMNRLKRELEQEKTLRTNQDKTIADGLKKIEKLTTNQATELKKLQNKAEQEKRELKAKYERQEKEKKIANDKNIEDMKVNHIKAYLQNPTKF